MKILFVAGNIYPMDNANSNLINVLKEEMESKGHEVYILGKSDDNRIEDDADRYYYKNYILNKFNASGIQTMTKKQKLSYFIKNLKQFFLAVLMKTNKTYIDKQYVRICQKKIEALHQKYQYDCIIAVSMPIYTNLALMMAKVDCLKIEYRLDAYAYNSLEKAYSFRKKLKIEEKILQRVDHVFLPELDYTTLMQGKFQKYKDKVSVLQFPNIKRREIHESDIVSEIKKEKNITFAFLGYLYPDIRNPKSTLECLYKLHQEIPIKLYILGGGCEDILSDYRQKMGDDLLVGRVSAQDAYSIIASVDYLLNIGNAVSHINMLPSKIFDYISSGKPIINFIKTKECPTIRVLGKYRNHINILDEDWESSFNGLKQFCAQKPRDLDFESIESSYYEHTPKFVATKMLEKIVELLDKGKRE